MRTIAEINKAIAEYERAALTKELQHISIHDDKTVIHGISKDMVYIPSPTGKLFHEDKSFVKLITGPYGSGKSTTCIQEMVQLACDMPYWFNGRRKARGLIIRNTAAELTTTTLNTWLQWFGDLGDIRSRTKPVLTYEHAFNDGRGIVELELMFLALDRPDDIRRLKSLEATFAYLNELNELPENVLSHIKGRVNGRYPSKSFCPDYYWSGVLADTNPPPESHWIYDQFEVNPPDDYKIFHQPPGLLKDDDGQWFQNPNCDNYKNLSNDYYTKLAGGQTKEFIAVYCEGKYGTVALGKRVYPEFNSDIHAVNDIEAIQGEPLYLGWDFGLTPACIVAQVSARGQLRILREYIGIDIGLRSFAESIVIPGLVKDFPYCKVGSSDADPAGNARDQIFEEMSCISELNSLGITTHAARTNNPDARIASVRFFLNRMIDGKSAFLISKKGCPVSYNAFAKDYIYKQLAVSGETRYKDTPEKNMASHPMDATQYLCLGLASDSIMTEKQDNKPLENMFNPVFRGL